MDPFPVNSWRISWDALDARAWSCLNSSGKIPPDVSRGRLFHGLPRLRLWDDPGGGPGCEAEPMTLTVYELFTAKFEREPVVRQAVWQRWADMERVREAIGQDREPVFLKPTIGVRDGAVSRERLASFLREACAFRVPAVWFNDTESVTSDIGDFGFEFFSQDQPPAALRMQWSFDMPPEWRPIVEWHARLREFLEDCLADGRE